MTKFTILGAGLAGLSSAYHIGHDQCIVFEKNSYAGGHIYSHQSNGCVWDEGPHVSFTQHEYVRNLFEQSVEYNFLEYECQVSNFYDHCWIPHPAQSNLYAIPEPTRSNCLSDFLKTREQLTVSQHVNNYAEWLQQAFGLTFAQKFPSAYTRKYWTCDPSLLSTDWVGNRVFYPDIKTVTDGYQGPAKRQTHYIKNVRYPTRGGYMSFAKKLSENANTYLDHEITSIDLREKKICIGNKKIHRYDRLINTIPLPRFIQMINNVPIEIQEAAKALRCSSLLLVNIVANHEPKKPYHWMYVYDESKYSTRINQINLLSPNNAPLGKTGIQVEVYESTYRPFRESHELIAVSVVTELQVMGLIDQPEAYHFQYIPFANVIFDHCRRDAQEKIFKWLEHFGLVREDEDLEPVTNWSKVSNAELGDLILAGRFGQWKYFWTDDCILRGKLIAENL